MRQIKTLICGLTLLCFSLTSSAQWTLSSFGNTAGVTHCFIETGGVLLSGGNGDGIYSSTNNGDTWTPSNTGIPSGSEILCLGKNAAGVYAGANNAIYFSTDNGASWSISTLTYPTFAFAFLSDTIFAATHGAGVLMSTNNGTSWTNANSGITTLMVLSIVKKGNLLYAGTTANGVFVSSNSGVSWTAANSNLPTSVTIRCLETDGTNLYAGTTKSYNPFVPNYGMFISPNNGAGWGLVNDGITINSSVYDITYVGNTLLAASGEVWRSLDNGSSWTIFMDGIDTTCIYGSSGFYETTSYVFYGREGGCDGSVYRIAKTELVSVPDANSISVPFSLFPNPTNQNATLTFANPTKSNFSLTLFDFKGSLVRTINNISTEKVVIDKQDLSSGLYFFILQSGKQTARGKLTIE